jgi:hypothetical protein
MAISQQRWEHRMTRILALLLALLPAIAVAQPPPGPGIPTATGTLSGAGMYCWNGSAVVMCGTGPAAAGGSVAATQQGPWTLSLPDADVGGDQTYTAAFSTTGQTLAFATTGFGSISIITDFSAGVGTVTYQEAPASGGPWSTTRCLPDSANSNVSASASVAASTSTTAVICPVQALYFHIVANPVTSGTINVTAFGRYVPKQTAIHALKSPSLNTRVMSAATTNATIINGSPAFFYGTFACNVNAAARYVHIYNLATLPTAGSGTPQFTIAVPALVAGSSPCSQFTLDRGVYLPSGIGITITTGFADTDATATGASEVVVNIMFGTSP